MSNKRIVIVGAGLAGLSAARYLHTQGIPFVLFEQESSVGGLCRSKKIAGFTFDCDGHLLHFKRKGMFSFVRRLLSDNLIEHRRSAWVYSYGRFCRYPFQANLYGLPPSVVKECLLGLMERPCSQQGGGKKQKNFYRWILGTFGRGIARHFMVPYNRKFWTVPPQDLTCDWLEGVVPVPSVPQIVEGTLKPNRRQYGYNVRFWYPRQGGIQQLPLALAKGLSNIRTRARVTQIDTTHKTVRLSSGDREPYDCLISTAALPQMGRIIKAAPAQVQRCCARLRWNSIYNLNLGIARKNDLKAHWVYFPQEETSFFRVGFYDNISRTLAPHGNSSMYVEAAYSCAHTPDKKLLTRRIKKDLERIGLLRRKENIIASEVNDIRYGYPIYDAAYAQAREYLLQYLESLKIFPAGRYGSWRYFSMEDAIADGIRAAKMAEKYV